LPFSAFAARSCCEPRSAPLLLSVRFPAFAHCHSLHSLLAPAANLALLRSFFRFGFWICLGRLIFAALFVGVPSLLCFFASSFAGLEIFASSFAGLEIFASSFAGLETGLMPLRLLQVVMVLG
jgi:hypothetical protein